MDPSVKSALITGGASIAAAIIGALIGRSDLLDRLFRPSRFWSLKGKWESSWEDLDDPEKVTHKELLIVERQKGSRVWGYITMETDPDKRWSVEGTFSGRFLQINYFPAKEVENNLFLDYGCYFFELQGDGSFKGYSIGFDWSSNEMGASTHRLRRIGRLA